VALSKISVKYAKISQNICQISLNFSQNFVPGALDIDPKARIHVRHEVRVEPVRIVAEVIICAHLH